MKDGLQHAHLVLLGLAQVITLRRFLRRPPTPILPLGKLAMFESHSTIEGKLLVTVVVMHRMV